MIILYPVGRYQLVCDNGINYSNSCFAECDGVTYTEGACDDEPSDCEATIVTVVVEIG